MSTATKPTPAPTPDALLPAVVPPPRPDVAFDADDPVALYMNTGVFEQLQRVAKLMSSSGLVPGHLREKQADCFLVAAQAFRWRVDPFAVAQCTFVLSGKLGYEGKLIAAVVNAKLDQAHALNYEYSGTGKDRKVVVTGRRRSEAKDRTVEGTVEGWATTNEKWKTMTDQMLSYRGAREWARRHMPEAIIGIQADEEVKEAVELERGADGAFAQPRTLGELTERLAPAPAAEPAKPCAHPFVPPSRVAKLAAGKSIVCAECGEELTNPDAMPERVVGEDDGPSPEDAVKAIAGAADKKTRLKE